MELKKGQRVRYTAENKSIPKDYETYVLETRESGSGEPIIAVNNSEGEMLLSWSKYWEPVDEKPSEDLFQ